jgi:hypothetical protein
MVWALARACLIAVVQLTCDACSMKAVEILWNLARQCYATRSYASLNSNPCRTGLQHSYGKVDLILEAQRAQKIEKVTNGLKSAFAQTRLLRGASARARVRTRMGRRRRKARVLLATRPSSRLHFASKFMKRNGESFNKCWQPLDTHGMDSLEKGWCQRVNQGGAAAAEVNQSCTSSSTRGRWPEVAAAATAITAGSGDGDEAGEESEGRGVEGGGAEVELGAELENIS